MKIKEIMIKEVKSVSPEMSALEALDLLDTLQISGLPVLDSNKKLVGMFTEKEVLSHLLPSYIDQVGKFIYEENPKATKRKLLDLSSMKVSQLMRKDVVTTNEENTLCEVARIMLTQKARRIPVVDKAGNILGIVARCDLLRALRKETQPAV